jgi:hypothetical protein
MEIRKKNRRLFLMPFTHPARRFLEEFLACLDECVGREIGTPDNAPLDQAWHSEVDGKRWTFSSFAYTFLAFDIELDGWLTDAPQLTESERNVITHLPYLRTLLLECEAAAHRERNDAMLPLIDRVQHLLDLWEDCILSRTASSK